MQFSLSLLPAGKIRPIGLVVGDAARSRPGSSFGGPVLIGLGIAPSHRAGIFEGIVSHFAHASRNRRLEQAATTSKGARAYYLKRRWQNDAEQRCAALESTFPYRDKPLGEEHLFERRAVLERVATKLQEAIGKRDLA